MAWKTVRLGAAAAVAACSVSFAWAERGGEVPRTRKEAAIVELGRRLFFDPLVSRSGLQSCGSCHDPEHGFSDSHRASDDDFGRTARHSQTLVDSGDSPTAHWDGEFESIEELVIARLGIPSGNTRGGYGQPPPPSSTPIPPIEDEPAEEGGGGAAREDGVEETAPAPRRTRDEVRSHGAEPPAAFDVRTLEPVHDRIERSGRYAEAFQAAYGSPSVTTSRLADSIAAYTRTIRSTEAPYDRHVRGDGAALGDAAKRGLALFRGRAGCVQCHRLDGSRAAFTDHEFHDTGIAWRRGGRAEDATDDGNAVFDPGRGRVTTARAHARAFKTPTLRDVALRPPYMHDGSLRTLEEVVRHYSGGGSADPEQDRRVRRLGLSDAEVADLVAFLESLTGEVRPGLAPRTWDARADRTVLRFTDAAGRPVEGLEVEVVAAGDTLPGDGPRTSPTLRLATDAKGRVEFVPPLRTHARLVLPDGLEPVGGTMVPDTCRSADVVLPVRGRTSVLLTAAKERPLPDRLRVRHEADPALPRKLVPTSILVRASSTEVGDRQAVLYEGWFRTDARPEVSLELPGVLRTTRRFALACGEPVRVDWTD